MFGFLLNVSGLSVVDALAEVATSRVGALPGSRADDIAAERMSSGMTSVLQTVSPEAPSDDDEWGTTVDNSWERAADIFSSVGSDESGETAGDEVHSDETAPDGLTSACSHESWETALDG